MLNPYQMAYHQGDVVEARSDSIVLLITIELCLKICIKLSLHLLNIMNQHFFLFLCLIQSSKS